jgi:DNA-directed RNA polymerase
VAIPHDIDRSLNRWLDQEEACKELTGFGTTRQGRAIIGKYRDPLDKLLAADRHQPHHKEIWRALKDAGRMGEQAQTDRFTDRLLTLGIIAAADERVGLDKDGTKNFRDQAIWLGQHVGLKRPQRVLEFKVGAWAIEMLTGLSVFVRDGGGLLDIPLTPQLDEFLNVVVETGIWNNAFFFPSTDPPEPWKQVSRGGLSPSNDWARVSLIGGHRRHAENAVRKAIADGKMRRVLDAVNFLAQTAFRINKPVLAFMRAREEPQIQKLRAEAAEIEGRKLKWRERQRLADLKSELRVWELDMAAAEAIAGPFFLPLQIDFRGRINPLPFLNFTRSDRVRSLFLFDRGEQIGEEGVLYLKSHVAGCADGNKWSTTERPSNLDLTGRIAWTDCNFELLRKIGNAVLRGEDDPAQWEWMLRDISNPYSFIAACLELAQALDEGPSFCTRLPIMFDATCSGLQHMCAMMRAEEGRYVNLVPSDELSDFYSLVGATVYRRAYDKIPEHMRAVEEVHRADVTVAYNFPKIPDEQLGLLRFFKDGNPFDRKIIKRPGMTYGYGSRAGGWQKTKRGRYRPKGMTAQIVEVLKERGLSTWGAHKLAKAAYDVIEEMMPAAKEVRNFLEKVAKVYAECNKPMRWFTRLGLPVVNAYYKPMEPERISITIEGKRHRTNLIPGDTDDIDATAVTSVSANLTHSADACHLHMVANVAAKNAIPLVTIHDCFGTTAPNARRLNQILREQFVRLHDYDWLGQVLETAKHNLPKSAHDKLPELPQRGNLDLAGVLLSFFAFK